MKLYIKQKVFSWRDQFTVKDEHGRDRYRVEGKAFSLGKKLHVYDEHGTEVVYIEQKLLALLPEFRIYMRGKLVAVINREFSLLRPKYTISGPQWEINGEFWLHNYEITRMGECVATISKEYMTWGDSYELNIVHEHDVRLVLAAVLVIDCVLDQASNNS